MGKHQTVQDSSIMHHSHISLSIEVQAIPFIESDLKFGDIYTSTPISSKEYSKLK